MMALVLRAVLGLIEMDIRASEPENLLNGIGCILAASTVEDVHPSPSW